MNGPLDWIADHRDECEAQASSSLQLRKEKKKSSKRKEDSSNMFDLLNVACSSRSSSLTTSKSSSASSHSGTKLQKSDKIKLNRKFVKLIDHNNANNSLTNFEYQVNEMTGNGNYCSEKIVKSL